MKSTKRTRRLIIAALAMSVGIGVLFGGHYLEWIQRFDLAAVGSANKSNKILHEYDQKTGKIISHTITTKPTEGTQFQYVIITDDPKRVFENSPPSALDYAVILESLHNRGYQHVNITTRLNWQEEPGLLAAGLDLKLALFKSAVVPIAVTRGPQESTMPPMLQNSLIPLSQVHGNNKLIPQVNRTALNAQIQGNSKSVFAGFYKIENNPPTDGHIPLLAQWGDKGIIPSYELLTMMQAHHITPDQVVVQCGRFIRLGDTGPVIPIDAYGQTPSPTTSKNSSLPKQLHADTIITTEKTATSQPYIATIHADGKRTNSTNVIRPERIATTLTLMHAYPALKSSTSRKRLPLLAEILIVLDAAIIVFWLKTASRSDQHLGFALTTALILVTLYAIMAIINRWTLISAPMATLLIGWLIPMSAYQTKPSQVSEES